MPRLSRRRALRGFAGATAAVVATGNSLALIHAQEASTPVAETSPEIVNLVQYIHPEKVYFWMPGMADKTVLAGLYGLDVTAYEEIAAEFAAAARGAAEELLADDTFAARVDRLPFAANARIAVLGESDTDSLQSWFEIVRHLLDLRRPDDRIELVNFGVSAMTTTQAFGPLRPLLGQQPDWIICGLGGNDAVRIGPEPTQTLVSLDETTRNLAELRRLADATTRAQWLWITRMPIDEARLEAYEPFRLGPVASVWRNADLEAINAWIREQPEPVADIYAAFGSPAPEELQESDGLHPTLAGHQVLAREFVLRLTS
jgi:lysophospholipase L1-like esterase